MKNLEQILERPSIANNLKTIPRPKKESPGNICHANGLIQNRKYDKSVEQMRVIPERKAVRRCQVRTHPRSSEIHKGSC